MEDQVPEDNLEKVAGGAVNGNVPKPITYNSYCITVYSIIIFSIFILVNEGLNEELKGISIVTTGLRTVRYSFCNVLFYFYPAL